MTEHRSGAPLPRLLGFGVLGLILLTTLGCNVFDPFDSPTSDAQLISAARACFDRGDIACANENYSKLTGDSADLKASESAYAILDQSGVTMAAFITAFGTGKADPGEALTRLAATLATGKDADARIATRKSIFSAFMKSTQISSLELRGFVEFLTSFSLAAELLAENTTIAGKLKKSDFAQNFSTCESAPVCLAAASCDARAGGDSLVFPGSNFADLTAADNSSALTSAGVDMGLMGAALTMIQTGLNHMQASSNQGSSTLANNLVAGIQQDPSGGRCFRQTLFKYKVGVDE